MYKISKINEVENFCSSFEIDNKTFYLLKCENGRSLKELGAFYYQALLTLMNYQVLEDLNNNIYKK